MLPQQGTMLVLVGTMTGRESQGIYGFEFDLSSGALRPLGLAAEAASPTFLAVHPTGRIVYGVNEVRDYDASGSGSVTAFAVDPESGRLTPIARRASQGGSPTHLTVSRTGRFVLVANYDGGTVAVLPIDGDGRLGEAVTVVRHTGSSVHPERQTQPHPHCVTLDPADRLAIVADLGIDRVRLYRFDPATGALEPNPLPEVPSYPGAGPRTFVFHADGARGFVTNELSSTITVYGFDGARSTLEMKQTISTVPDGFTGENTPAAIRPHPRGRFVYASNRGHDSIAVFGVQEGTGRLVPIEYQPSRGRTPRHFGMDPRGDWIIAANKDSDSLAVFRINRVMGHLTPVGDPVPAPSPTCVRFVARSG